MTDPQPQTGGEHLSRSLTVRFGVLVVLVAGLAALSLAMHLPTRLSHLDLRHAPVPGPLVVGGAAVLVYVLVPRTAVAFAAGAALGTLPATLYVVAGVTAGAVLAFGTGRLLGRTFVAGRLRGRAAAIEAALGRRPFYLVAAARMLPVAHFGLANFVFGVTRVRLPAYLAGTALGIVPATVAYTALGHAVARADAEAIGLASAAVTLNAVVGAVGSLLLWRPGRRAAEGRRSGSFWGIRGIRRQPDPHRANRSVGGKVRNVPVTMPNFDAQGAATRLGGVSGSQGPDGCGSDSECARAVRPHPL